MRLQKCRRTGKLCYTDPLQVKLSFAKKPGKLDHQRVYRCEFCHHLHVTTQLYRRGKGSE